MKTKKILSIVLSVLFIITSLSVVAFAKEEEVQSDDDTYYKYYTATYATQKAKVNTMTLEYENDNYAMYIDRTSGEFAIMDKVTGEYTFSNPYDLNVNSDQKVNLAKNALLSQILLEYKDTASGTPAYISSYGSAATSGQIAYKTLKNGVRVEYAMGTVEAKRLVPIWVEQSRFENNILNVLEQAKADKRMTEAEETVYNKMRNDTYYKFYDQTNPNNEIYIETWRESYHCLVTNPEMKIYVFQGLESTKSRVEKLIRKYCPAYTYDELEYDHNLTEYEAQEKELPLFRLAVEYTFDEKGFTATIPAKSIRYNSTNYALLSIVLLPYFGCTTVKTSNNTVRNGGYIFIPDGSGTLLSYYKADGTANVGTQSTGVMYGPDNSKETLTSSANAESAKVPVYGLVEDYSVTYSTSRVNRPDKKQTISYSRGYTAIITSGETFASVVANLGQMAWSNLATTTTEYNTVYASFSMTQEDTVEMGGTLGGESALSTTMDTKYTGNYSIRYVLLSDTQTAKDAGAERFEPTYVGMADAYRDYLIDTDQLRTIENVKTENGIPLYVESFGAIKATSSFLTFPITVTTPLTTFDDVKTMMEIFAGNGIYNQRFILTGFGNGTMTKSYYPTYANWEGKLGGSGGFKKLLSYASENGYTVIPQYDFVNVEAYKGGFNMDKYAARTMSGRYAVLREYDFVLQQYSRMGKKNLVSASAYDEIYTKFAKKYNKYGVDALGAKTIGAELNSDFSDKNPLMRQEALDYTEDLLSRIAKDNSTFLVSGGNAYTFKYTTDVIELPLDNSGYAISSYSVPFIGIVLHGYKNYAGKAVNMDGDTTFYVLKSLENGAGLYFILSYRNTELVKTSEISKYYSMMFDTLQSEVVSAYKTLNDAIGDLTDAKITSHTFPTAYRMTPEVASVIFGLEDKFNEEYKTSEKNYFDAVDAVDELIRNQRTADEAISVEVAATEKYNTAKARLEVSSKIIDRYNTGDVVSVTYTTPAGTTRTFYINYNTYDVVVKSDNGKVFVVGAESFVSDGEIKYDREVVKQYEAASAYTPTARQKTSFDNYYAELESAIAAGNTTMIERRKATVSNLVSSMTKASDVYTAKTAEGSTVIINYSSSPVIVKVSDTDFRTIASQSYIVVSK